MYMPELSDYVSSCHFSVLEEADFWEKPNMVEGSIYQARCKYCGKVGAIMRRDEAEKINIQWIELT